VFLWGLALTGLAILASAATSAVGVLLALRLIAGATGAVSFVVGGGLMSQAGRLSSNARARCWASTSPGPASVSCCPG
jgi:hypothetical protein